jgi:RNA polymerase sigma-19 factor, ECF subfamily
MSPKDQSLALVDRIYATRGADLLQYVRHRLRNDADAADIAHEAFLRFLRLDYPERVTNPDAYIFRIAGNLLWEKRLRQREESGQPVQDERLQDEHTPFDFAFAGQTAARLREALDRLPVMQRAVLLLHLRDGSSFADIATHTGVSNTMAKKHLKSAITTCRKLLKDLATDPGTDL